MVLQRFEFFSSLSWGFVCMNDLCFKLLLFVGHIYGRNLSILLPLLRVFASCGLQQERLL